MRGDGTRKLDVHHHLFPKEYLHELGQQPNPRGPDLPGIPFWHSEEFYEVTQRLNRMDEEGIDLAILSLGPPGVDHLERKLAVKMAKRVNEEFAELSEKYPGRFFCLAVLPLIDTSAALDELERSVKDLGMRGLVVYSNAAGKPIDVHPTVQILEKASSLGVPILLHPTSPIMGRSMLDYRLWIEAGYLFETTIALLRLIHGGTLDKLPNLRIIAPHLGGTLPYILGRMEYEWKMRRKERRVPNPPSLYLRRIYLDTVCHLPNALFFASELQGGSEKLLFGSDYPYRDFPDAVKTVSASPLNEEDYERIFYKNASKLFGLK